MNVIDWINTGPIREPLSREFAIWIEIIENRKLGDQEDTGEGSAGLATALKH